MDVLWFLNERLRTIRAFYRTARPSFETKIDAIERGLPPFDKPPYDETGEPPFMEEWSEATLGLDLLGRSALSMISASLKLYFETWEAKVGLTWGEGERKKAFKKGFLKAYWNRFAEVLPFDPASCHADLELIEQVVLGRNLDQHPEVISSLHVRHEVHDLRRFKTKFFVQDTERAFLSDDLITLMTPRLYVDDDRLRLSIEEIEKLAEWLEPRLLAAA